MLNLSVLGYPNIEKGLELLLFWELKEKARINESVKRKTSILEKDVPKQTNLDPIQTNIIMF